MALTIAEADKYSRTTLLRGIVEEIVSESPVLLFLPFIEVLGNSLTYNRESTLPSAAFFGVGDTWVESTPVLAQVTVSLKILGGDSDVDNFLRITRANEQDLEAEVIGQKAKAIGREFEDEFIYGDTAVDPKGFDGLHKLIGSGPQQVNAGSGATPGAGSFSLLDQTIDLIKPGTPDLLIMSRRTRRQIQKLARSQGWDFALAPAPGEIGRQVALYNQIPIAVSDYITDTETIASGRFSAKTGGTASSIFAVKLGEGHLVGLEATEGIVAENIGSLSDKDARRWRLKWYVAIALFSTLSVARLDGISSADWTN